MRYQRHPLNLYFKTRSCLRPNLTKGVANWPGVEGQNQQSARQEVPLPYETEVGMKEELMEGPVCQGAVRQLVCQYQ